MMKMLHILNVVGARPNFMKVAPLFREYSKHSDLIKATLLHTGQHYDDSMSQSFFVDLQMPKPDISLGVGSGSHAYQTAKIMIGMEEVLLNTRPDLVLVVGDVNSTMASAIVAAKLNIPIAHVEAGLRSYDRTMPEEINRIVTDALADILFTTSPDANANLQKEGIDSGKVFLVGNTMIDTLMAMKPYIQAVDVHGRFPYLGETYGFITLHRPSNVDQKDTLSDICDALAEVQQHVKLLWPLHPRTRKMLATHDLLTKVERMRNVCLTEPLGYRDSLALMSRALFVVTDSGGIQEETTVLGVPCLTLRENTERPITVTEGTNELLGTNPSVIIEKVIGIIRGNGKKGKIPQWWDGKASERIAEVLLRVMSIEEKGARHPIAPRGSQLVA